MKLMNSPESPTLKMNGLLIFKFSSDEYCIEIKNIKAILKETELNLPFDLNDCEGKTIQVAGNDYLFLDLAKMLGFNSFSQNDDNRLLLTEFYSHKLCFLVEVIPEIIMVDRIFIQHNIEFTNVSNKAKTKWKLKFEGRDIFFPDYENISKEVSSKREMTMSEIDLFNNLKVLL